LWEITLTERNAPCPCGSGKKFKRCCGNAVQASSTDPRALNRAIAYAGALGRRRESFCREYTAIKKQALENISKGLVEDTAKLGEVISCHCGCSDCCSLYIAASLQECEAIVYWLYQHGETLDAFLSNIKVWQKNIQAASTSFNTINALYGKKLLSHASDEEKEKFRWAMEEYESQNISCPFLFDNACSIYEVRPYVCAGVVSISPAEWCRSSHPDHRRMKYMKTEIKHEKDMPYFIRPRGGLLFANMPQLVMDILDGGYASLAAIPGLEGIQQQINLDPEVLSIIRSMR
jgi:hypothetical protein